jgi:alpha-L-fucosidase
MSENSVDRDARLAWWREARFGMFIHWGLYALPAGEWKGKPVSGIGEWIMFKERIPIAEYEELAAQFNPVQFDAEAWAQLAQDAGMKYLVITAKHHDGFALFASQADAFNIVEATPFKRDVIAELAAACARRDIKFGVYYSQAQDWHAPGGAIWETPHQDAPRWEKTRWDARQEGDFDEYLERKAIPQLRELLSNYGPISIVWFDTPLNVMTVERAAKIEKLVHELQPHCLVSGRLGGQHQADYDSEGDNRIPRAVRPGDWETPATLNHTWGYKKDDHDWKTPEQLIFNLVDIVSKGGNYLLNVGPTGEGIIPQPSADSLRAVGRWLQTNSEAIYGCGATPFGAEFESNAWRATTKPGHIYLHFFEWPGAELRLNDLPFQVKSATLLADETAVPFVQDGPNLTLNLPVVAPGKFASVLRLQTE